MATDELTAVREERGDVKCEGCGRWIIVAREQYFEDIGGGYICRDCGKDAPKVPNPEVFKEAPRG